MIIWGCRGTITESETMKKKRGQWVRAMEVRVVTSQYSLATF